MTPGRMVVRVAVSSLRPVCGAQEDRARAKSASCSSCAEVSPTSAAVFTSSVGLLPALRSAAQANASASSSSSIHASGRPPTTRATAGSFHVLFTSSSSFRSAGSIQSANTITGSAGNPSRGPFGDSPRVPSLTPSRAQTATRAPVDARPRMTGGRLRERLMRTRAPFAWPPDAERATDAVDVQQQQWFVRLQQHQSDGSQRTGARDRHPPPRGTSGPRNLPGTGTHPGTTPSPGLSALLFDPLAARQPHPGRAKPRHRDELLLVRKPGDHVARPRIRSAVS